VLFRSQQIQPRAATAQPVVIVDIDERSLAVHGQWPWARTLMADLTAKLFSAGAATVGFDIVFAEPDRLSPGRVANSLPDLPAAQGTVHHTDVVRGIQAFLGPQDLLALDAGAQRIWSTFGLRMPYPGQLLVPGGTGVMGWAGPAAAAAKLVFPEKRVTALAGDGGFMMTVQVIPTAVQQKLDVVFMVSNNSGLGMVRDNLGEKRIAVDFNEVDFAKVAEGMGARGLTVYRPGDVRDALEEAHKMGGPVLIDIKVDPAASHHQAVDNDPL